MTRPPEHRPPPEPQDNLVELPLVDDRAPTPGARLASEPAPIAAWLEHATPDDLDDRLAELARELAEGPRQAATPSRRWLPWAIASAAALILMGLGAHALLTPPEPQVALPLPSHQPLPVAPEPLIPSPAPLPLDVASVEPAPKPETTPKPPPALEPRSLESSDPTTPLQVVAGVEALLKGDIHLTGTPRAPQLRLRGSAVIDVAPGSVDSLHVRSDAAQVSVLGTRFSVDEGATATVIGVERGKVAVHCRAGQQAQLVAGDQLECPNANGLYLQAKLLQQQGAPVEELLPVVQAGLNFPDSALHGQLEAMRQEIEDVVAHRALWLENGQDHR
jgi:hypothetical protein